MRIFRGWLVAAGAFGVLFVAYGTQYSFGIFFSALLAEFGWSRASLSGAFALYAFLYSSFGYPAGRLTDRWGPRVVVSLGGLVLGSALLGMSRVTALWQPYVLYGLVAAVGMGTAYVPCHATVVRWFVRRRGLAVGLASSGGSVGTFVLPPLAQLLIEAVGWRTGYLVFGGGLIVLVALLARLLARDPESAGLHPDGDPAPPPAAAETTPWPVGRAARTRAFWMLAAVFTATWLPLFIPLVHGVQLARDLGLGPTVGALGMSALGAGAVLGRVAMGWLSDRVPRRLVLGVCFACEAVGFLLLIAARTPGELYLASFVFGYAYGGGTTMFAAIIGDFFGRAQAGALVGALFALAGSTAAWGPLLAGWVHDRTGAYTGAFLVGAALNVLAIVLLACARPPSDRQLGDLAGRQLGGLAGRQLDGLAGRPSQAARGSATLGRR